VAKGPPRRLPRMDDLRALLPQHDDFEFEPVATFEAEFGPVFARLHADLVQKALTSQGTFDLLVGMMEAAPNSDEAIDQLNVRLGQDLQAAGIALDAFREFRMCRGAA
jgi:hypothetical protein